MSNAPWGKVAQLAGLAVLAASSFSLSGAGHPPVGATSASPVAAWASAGPLQSAVLSHTTAGVSQRGASAAAGGSTQTAFARSSQGLGTSGPLSSFVGTLRNAVSTVSTSYHAIQSGDPILEVHSLDTLVVDDDATEASPVIAAPTPVRVQSAFSGAADASATALPTPDAQSGGIAPAATASTASSSSPSASTTTPTAMEHMALFNAANDQWQWAAEQGFFQSARKPHLILDTTKAQDDSIYGGLAAAVSGVAKVGWVLHPHLELISDIRIASHIGSVAISDNDPRVDIETIVLHEGWHAEAMQSPDLNKFNGALLHNDAQAQHFWKAATWASNQAGYQEVKIQHPEVVQSMRQVGPNLSNIFEESGADTASFAILAHAKSQSDWDHRMLLVEGTRAHGGLYLLGTNDPHETQESLNILAHIGYDKLRTLNPEQTRQLIDAVGADGALLAAAKQGWVQRAQTLADASDTFVSMDHSIFTPDTQFMMRSVYNQLKPDALTWTQTPAVERSHIASQAMNKVQTLWEQGGALDYSYIAPGLRVDLPGHGTAPSYEVDPLQAKAPPSAAAGTGSAIATATPVASPSAATTLSQEQQTDITAHRHAEALQEWQDMAHTLGYTRPEQVSDIADSQPFDQMVAWATWKDRDALAAQTLWAPDVATFLARRDAAAAQKASPPLASTAKTPRL